MFDEQGQIAIHVTKSPVAENDPRAVYDVDALSGATLTSNGVNNLVRFWVGPDGFGPYLQKIRQGAGA